MSVLALVDRAATTARGRTHSGDEAVATAEVLRSDDGRWDSATET